MTRDEMFISVQSAIAGDMRDAAESFGEGDNTYTRYMEYASSVESASTLAELGEICIENAWDLPTFISYVIMHSGWNREDLGRWTEPNLWDT